MKALATKKLTLARSSKEDVRPFIVAVCPTEKPTRCCALVGEILYERSSCVDALQFALTIFLTFNFSYPKATLPTWLLLQRIFMRISVQSDKLSAQFNKAFSFFEKSLATANDTVTA